MLPSGPGERLPFPEQPRGLGTLPFRPPAESACLGGTLQGIRELFWANEDSFAQNQIMIDTKLSSLSSRGRFTTPVAATALSRSGARRSVHPPRNAAKCRRKLRLEGNMCRA